jgi:hypothetical protein
MLTSKRPSWLYEYGYLHSNKGSCKYNFCSESPQHSLSPRFRVFLERNKKEMSQYFNDEQTNSLDVIYRRPLQVYKFHFFSLSLSSSSSFIVPCVFLFRRIWQSWNGGLVLSLNPLLTMTLKLISCYIYQGSFHTMSMNEP